MMNVRIEELTAYLNALTSANSSGYKCDREIAEVIKELRRELSLSSDCEYKYRLAILTLTGDADSGFVSTNNLVFATYANDKSPHSDIYFPRWSGVTTSLAALAMAFDDVVFIADEGTALKYAHKRIISANQPLRGRHFETVVLDSCVEHSVLIGVNYKRMIKAYQFE